MLTEYVHETYILAFFGPIITIIAESFQVTFSGDKSQSHSKLSPRAEIFSCGHYSKVVQTLLETTGTEGGSKRNLSVNF